MGVHLDLDGHAFIFGAAHVGSAAAVVIVVMHCAIDN
jgi:hypothetical protein